jgi:hypothetical protein
VLHIERILVLAVPEILIHLKTFTKSIEKGRSIQKSQLQCDTYCRFQAGISNLLAGAGRPEITLPDLPLVEDIKKESLFFTSVNSTYIFQGLALSVTLA